jgi:GNAT superfamily N-acetyltransferase
VITIRPARPDAGDIAGLAEVLVDCVDGGASVGFMQPFDRDRAEAFWSTAIAGADHGERLVLVAEDMAEGSVMGTVQLVLAAPENQPHRGEIAKMLVHRRARRRGVGAALMEAAEAAARDAGKTLLVLDTASPDAERLYGRLGWQRVGLIPRYALWPDGGYVDTTVFYKDLAIAQQLS